MKQHQGLFLECEPADEIVDALVHRLIGIEIKRRFLVLWRQAWCAAAKRQEQRNTQQALFQ